MFSVVCPTMWRSTCLDVMINERRMLDNPLIGELLVIDNDPVNQRILNHPKVRVVYSGSNLYVNPSWDLGVKEAKYDQICLMSDDTLFDDDIFEQISEHVTTSNGVIGLGPHCVKKEGSVTSKEIDLYDAPGLVPEFYETFGMLMFLHKDCYASIPVFKIYFGDTWLFAYNAVDRLVKNWYIHNFDVITATGTTSRLPMLNSVAQSDVEKKNAVFDPFLRHKNLPMLDKAFDERIRYF